MSEATDAEEREVMDWRGYGVAVRELAQAIADDGYRPEMILAIARGGLFCAGSLGYVLSVKNIYVMNCEYYTGVDERLEVPIMLPPTPDLVDHRDSDILIADDVADTGHTLKMVYDFCLPRVRSVRTAVSVREAVVHRRLRLGLAPHRPLDQLPLVNRTPDRH